MKALITLLLMAGLTSAAPRPTFAQHDHAAHPGTTALRHDPVFRGVLNKQLKYPYGAQHNGLFTRLFIGFDVDGRGRITNVTSLMPLRSQLGFETTVEKALARMPHLHPRYEGHYVLPVAFVLRSYERGAPLHEPTAALPLRLLGKRIMLDEVRVIAGSHGTPTQLIYQ